MLGGAAVTEEIFPGFKFSVASYVVSLLRPEIIRELDLPRHGLEILPLDGTFTPMPDGDYLWRVNDHAKTRREIARHSKLDAEAYDEYGKAMVEMGRFVKPILTMTPPDPTSLEPRGLMNLLFLGRRFRALSDQDKYNQVQLMTMSAVDFLDQWFETDVLEGDDVGVRHHRHVSRRALAGHGVRAAPSLHGGDRRRVSLVGTVARRHRSDLAGHRRRRARSGRRNPHRDGGLEDHREGRCRRRCRSRQRRLHHRRRRLVERRPEPDVPENGRARNTCRADFVEDVKRYKYRGSSGKVNLALDALPDFKAMPGAGPHLRGAISISPSVDYMERAYDDAKYGRYSRRPYIDIVIPEPDGPFGRASGQARDVVLRPVRAVQLEGRGHAGTTIARRSATP